MPVEPQKYDLILETGRGFKRVQVKSTTRFSNNGWQASVSHRPDKDRKREPYSPDDVDLFFVIDGDMNLYLVPIEAVGGRIAISLRSYENFRVGNARSMLDSSPD
ncbi:MAG: group I intron-associated PD-(D/E)XK endonuclease [Actinomadura sp.]